jgi:hypothetical protein
MPTTGQRLSSGHVMSLRVKASGGAGNGIDQTVIHAVTS